MNRCSSGHYYCTLVGWLILCLLMSVILFKSILTNLVEMAVQLVHSQRIGARTAPITYCDEGCYIWTKSGRTQMKEEMGQAFEQVYVSCAGCRAEKRAGNHNAVVSTLKFNATSNQWIGDPALYIHICQPANVNEVLFRFL